MIIDTLSIVKLDKLGIKVPSWQRVVSKRQLDIDGPVIIGVLEDIDDPVFVEVEEVDECKEDYYDYVRETYGKSVIMIMYPKIKLLKQGSVQISKDCSPVILPDDSDVVNKQIEEYEKIIKKNLMVTRLGLIFRWGLTENNEVVFLPNQEVGVY